MDGSLRLCAIALAAFAGLSGCQQSASVPFVDVGPSPQNVGSPEACAPIVERQIASMGLTDSFRGVTFQTDRTSSSSEGRRRIRGYSAWVTLTTCQGYTVVSMRQNCRIKDVYTTDECTLPTGLASGP